MKRMRVLSWLIILVLHPLFAENLQIPPLLEGDELELVMKRGELELPWGKSSTMGFNGDYLGPTIRVSNGQSLDISIENNLGEDSTVHWHGLHVPAEFDGGPHQIIEQGAVWTPSFTVDQEAATLWYHPHLMGKTAEHAYNGLAGMFIIEDDYSRSLEIPGEYGINDFPIILQDKRIHSDGSFIYSPTMPDYMHGYMGNTMLTNGSVNPDLEIPAGTYRFRILNGSNSTIFRIRFSDGRNFTVIASDGGFLPESVEADHIVFSPGERFEILIDFEKNSEISLLTDIYGGDSYKSLRVKTGDRGSSFISHPAAFSYKPVNTDGENNIKRDFLMQTRGMHGFTINGKTMAMDRIDFSSNRNSTEIWTIRNGGSGMGMGMMNFSHSFHVHDVQFSVLSINGKEPHPLYRGPKDTVLLWPGDKIEIALRFRDYTGIYMYHCHLLEHEDRGMMGQFLVK